MKSILCTGLIVLAASVLAATQRGGPPAAPSLPPLSMTCPMHPDVVESRAGSCPLCKMALVPVRLDTAWLCPVHTHVMGDEGGTCRLCGRALVQARVAVTWTCLTQPGIDRLEPGTCPDGTAMVQRRTLRPHGNHNPQHGGQFFMAPDNWHHLEGTYPGARTFRLYVYDDYARPLSPAAMRQVQARVVTRETFDPRTRTTREITAAPLRLSRDGRYFEARVDTPALPAEMTAKIRIKPDAPEYRFDFTFHEVTREPARGPEGPPLQPNGGAAARGPEGRPLQPAGAAGSASGAAGPRVPAAAVDPLAPLEIPDAVPAIVEQLALRSGYIRDLIRDGNFAAVWVPAFHAKDLAIALEPHLGHLPPAAREAGEPALRQVVRLAWLLDAFGDVGNRQQLEAGYAEFSDAVAGVVRAFGEAPR